MGIRMPFTLRLLASRPHTVAKAWASMLEMDIDDLPESAVERAELMGPGG